MQHVVARHHHRRQDLLRRLGVSFPGVCVSRVEDAVDKAFEAALLRPAMLEAAEASSDARAFNLLYRIAWRNLRAEWRRPCTRREMVCDAMEDLGHLQGDGDVHAVVTRLSIEQLFEPAARQFGAGRKAALGRALRARVLEGASDVEAAAAHRVPREYVNRARSWMREELAA